VRHFVKFKLRYPNCTPVFVLFVLVGHCPPVIVRPVLEEIKNRYWPLWYFVWIFVGWCAFRSANRPPVTLPQLPNSVRALGTQSQCATHNPAARCGKTAWFPVFYFKFATLFAQAAIMRRFITDLSLFRMHRSSHACDICHHGEKLVNYLPIASLTMRQSRNALSVWRWSQKACRRGASRELPPSDVEPPSIPTGFVSSS